MKKICVSFLAVVLADGLAVLAAGPAAAADPAPPAAHPETQVVSLIGDHMVVQRGRPVRLAGTDVPGQAIRATLAGRATTAKTDGAGRWSLALPALDAGGPFELTVAGSRTLTFGDVWSGEVWLASGQSNMELPITRTLGADDAVAGGCPGIRLFTVEQKTAGAPKSDVAGRWQACDPTIAAGFSAVAYHFGREVHRALGVPVGLIQSTWGGTPAEAWTPREALAADPTLKPLVDVLDAAEHDPQRRADLAKALSAWEAKSFHQDTGNRGERMGFAKAGGSGWAGMQIPQVWENAGLNIDGAVWFRREVTIPAPWAGRDLSLSLGAIDDFDVTYWNGERVGATGAETPQYYAAARHYVVPARLVKAGRNIVAVRVFDHYGSGGFAGSAAQLSVGPVDPPAALAPAPGAAPLPLAGTWQYKIERRLPPAVVDWSTRPAVLGADDPQSATVLWNAMLAPLTVPSPLPLAGVIWYQGESNVGRAAQYRALFPTMIRAWRTAFHEPTLPFLYVQLPNFDDPVAKAPIGEGGWAELREAQATALREPRTGMAVALDVGESANLHPRNKHEVGRRLALQALRMVYGRDVLAIGPTFQSAVRAGAAIRVRFGGATGGLETSDGAPPRGFLIAGPDHVWHEGTARIDRDGVVVSSADVPAPVAVRYGWGNDPPNTLRNGADLPAAPFRTDDWPAATAATAEKTAR
ncbi:MAG TPA: sialate O-acetylesterase [Polyangia bacterium]|nr:sialate O-acetylesterase [Polyangia bacterium]